MNYNEIGMRIRARRKAIGLSQEQLAEKINISVTHMSHIETGGTKLSLPVLVDLANALSCGVDDLLQDSLVQCEPIIRRDIAVILDSCTPEQLRVICDLVRVAKSSLDRNV